MKNAILAIAVLAAVSSANAADYDYEVEYVKSARGSCVKTDILPEPGLTFGLDVRFDEPFYQLYGGKIDLNKAGQALFGSEEPAESGFRSLFRLDFGGNDSQVYTMFAGFGRHGNGPWEFCRIQDGNESLVGCRYQIVFDGKHVSWGPFKLKLDGARKQTGKSPLALFGVTLDNGSVKSYGCYEMSLYGASFYRDGKAVGDFVPVVKGGVAGLFDKVSKKFYASVTGAPLTAGPKKTKVKAKAKGERKNVDFSIPIFEDDFSEPKLFAERWNFLGHAQKTILVKDGAVRFPSGNTGDGISWKGDLPDEFAAEAEVVLFPAWSEIKDPKDGDYHWVSMGCDYGNFGVCSDGNGVCLWSTTPGQPTRGCYPRIANYRGGEPVTVRFERRKMGESMMSYTYFVNGVQLHWYTAPTPKKKVGFNGVEHWNALGIDCFNTCPFEIRRVTVYAIKGEKSANLVSNSGFEFDNDGVPLHYCNRNYCEMGRTTVEEYKEKYLRCFRVDRGEKHSGRQSLKLAIGPFVRSFDFFAWSTPTQKGRSAVLSVWAKASEPGVKFKLKLANDARTVELTTDWRRYEVATTNMPAPGIFSPVWFDVPELAMRKTEAAIWLDDIQLEIVDPPKGGFDPAKTYATEYHPKAGDAESFAPGKPVKRPAAERKVPLTPAENALNGFELPKDGLVLGHYDFYMNEKTAGFRVWNEQGEMEEKSVDISKLAPGTHEVTVKAFGRDWKASVRKLAYKKGATQVNQWSRSLVHDGEPVFLSAPCLISRENGPKDDGTSTQIDILADAGFKYLNLQNNLNVRDIEMSQKTLAYARTKGMKFMVWSGEGELNEVGDIRAWQTNQPTDWSRQKMFDLLDSEDVITHLVLDEPEGRKADDVRAYMLREKARFPYKPVQMNNSWLGIAGRFAGLPTDILMVDFYLTCDGTTVETVVSKVDVLRSIAPGKPCWYFMESENSLHCRIPSYREQVAQCWGSTAAGASGLSWFVNMPTSRGCYDALRDVNRELLDNVAFLCSDELCGGAIVSEAKTTIRCLTRKHGDEWRIYTACLSPHPVEKFAVKLPRDVPQDAKVEVLYENRTLKAKNGLFGDSYDGFGRHIYRIVK